MLSVKFFGLEDVGDLERELAEAGASPSATAGPVVRRALMNIKEDSRRRISGHPTLPHLPRAISYDSQDTPKGAKGEVGPDKSRKQGPLGNIAEFGTVNNAPKPFMAPAGEAEEPRFVKAMEAAALKALGW